MRNNEQVIRYWFEQFNQGKEAAVAVLDEVVAHNYVQHDPETPVEGRAAMGDFLRLMFDAFPDCHLTLEELLSTGDRIVYRALISGTHRGEFMGVPATGKTFRTPLISVARMVDGKVADEWQVWDVMGMMRQLGALPADFLATAS